MNPNSSIIYLLFVVVSFLSCTKKETVEKEQLPSQNLLTNASSLKFNHKQLTHLNVALGSLIQKNLASELKVNGMIDVPPQNLISISIPLGGYLQSSTLLPGMYVKKGQKIAILENPEYIQIQQDYLITKTKLNFSKLDLQRQKELNKEKSVSDKIYEIAQNEYNTQIILLNSYAEKLRAIGVNPNTLTPNTISKNTVIYSPIDGFVAKINANIGKYLTPSEVLFELINVNDLHIVLQVFEKDIPKLKIGQQVTIFTNNDTSKTYQGKIILIPQTISEKRTVEVHAHFNSYIPKLLPGTYLNGIIKVLYSDCYVLAEEAIVNFDSKKYIFITNDQSVFTMQEVQTGVKQNNWIEILNAESLQNKKIVFKGAYSLLMAFKNKEEE